MTEQCSLPRLGLIAIEVWLFQLAEWKILLVGLAFNFETFECLEILLRFVRSS